MAIADTMEADEDRLDRLKGYLRADPANLDLLADAAETARRVGQLDQAKALIEQSAGLGPLPPRLINLSGLLALDERRYDLAVAAFERLSKTQSSPEIRFNLAWAKSMLKDYESALAVLGEDLAAAMPQAAVLRIQMLHFLGRLDDALAEGVQLTRASPVDPALMGALSIVAADLGDATLARRYADQGGDSPDALTVLGLFDLDEDRLEAAKARFHAALAKAPNNARAHLGAGLDLLLAQDPRAAGEHLDRAATLFGTHLGSWIAAGWAHFLAGDTRTSRERFDCAVALDHSFAEAHGALAVLDVADGQIQRATRRTELALRLDRNCLSATLANITLLDRSGRGDVAERLRQSALSRPLGESGRTIAKALLRWNMAAKSELERPGGGRRSLH